MTYPSELLGLVFTGSCLLHIVSFIQKNPNYQHFKRIQVKVSMGSVQIASPYLIFTKFLNFPWILDNVLNDFIIFYPKIKLKHSTKKWRKNAKQLRTVTMQVNTLSHNIIAPFKNSINIESINVKITKCFYLQATVWRRICIIVKWVITCSTIL